ncbi:MAG: hypothetical protein NC429_16415 [Lachnospiraceae bacterium]|nr:hypothetical protein [Lachnospiraceae bacterium]
MKAVSGNAITPPPSVRRQGVKEAYKMAEMNPDKESNNFFVRIFLCKKEKIGYIIFVVNYVIRQYLNLL